MTYRKLPSGVQDILPDECRCLMQIKARLQHKFTACGFEPVASAALEYYDTYSEIKNRVPQERMFKCTDTDGRLLVLRPDTTLSISRIAAAKTGVSPARLYYFSDKWDMQSAGGISNREIYQAGVECLGEEGVFSDAQAIAFAVECLKEAGLENFVLDIGHVGYFKGLLEGSGLSEEDAEAVRAYVNAKDGLNAERILRRAGADENLLNNVLALPALFGGAEVLDAAPLPENEGARAAIAHLKALNGLLVKMGYEKYICFDLGTVRKLSYYSGVVFTALVKELGAAVLSGGRYDNLADDFGAHIPAVGFAIGLKRLLIALERQGNLPEARPLDCVVVSDKGAEEVAYLAFQRMAGEGKRVRLCAACGIEAAKRERATGQTVLFAQRDGLKEI